MMVVYVELVFFENIIVDFFVLKLCGKVTLSNVIHPWYASAFGAVYACLMPMIPVLQTFICKTGSLFAMVFICYGFSSKFKPFIQSVAVFGFMSALFGIISAVMPQKMFYVDNVPFFISLVASLSAYLLYKISLPALNTRKIMQNKATVKINEKTLSALIDSGNSLYYKEFPVILVQKGALTDIEQKIKPIIIPYSTVGNAGAMIGFLSDNISIDYCGKTSKRKCAVALCDQKLENGFEALLHPDLFKESV